MGEKSPKKPATEDEVRAGKAIFHVRAGRSRVYDLGCPLPVKAILKEDIDFGDSGKPVPKGTMVEVVQVEIVDGTDVLVGFRIGAEDGTCVLDELEIMK